MNEKWNQRLMGVAQLVATWSKHPDHGVGCVIVNSSNAILSTGYNGLPRGSQYTPERSAVPERSLWFEHAERNAIFQAAYHGVALRDTTIVVPWYPCSACMRAIIQSGISRLVCYRPDYADRKWGHDFDVATQMATASGLQIEYYQGPGEQREDYDACA